jgi:hypothetical protein
LELIDLKSKFTLKCKKYYIKKQKHTFFFINHLLHIPKHKISLKT